MNKRLLFLFAAMLFCVAAQATDYFVAELSGTTLTFKKTTTAPDEVTSWDATNTSNSYPGPEWQNSSFTAVVIDPSFADARPTSCYRWFAYNENVNNLITSITGLEYLNTCDVTSIRAMFDSCSGLTTLDLSSFETGNVTTMSGMFEHCINLTSIDLSSFDTRKVTDMAFMFLECSSLTSLDLSNFNTQEVTNMTRMFAECNSLASLDLTSFNTSKVTSMYGMFEYCSSLTSLDLSSFDCRTLTNAESMFTECSNLQTIYITDGLGNLDHDPISSQWMFTYCYSLSGGAGAVYVTNNGYSGVCGRIDTGGIGTAYFSPAFILANATENNSVIYQFRNCFKAKATLADRTLYKDGKWNTICLPFDVDLTDTNSPLYGATVKELDTEAGTYDHVTGFDNGTLYLNFKDVTTTMTAGTPYLVKWESGDNLVNPSFLPVNISNTTNNVPSTDGKVTFTGTYAPVSITSGEGDDTKLYLGGDNTIFYPNTAMTIGCQRAYFQLNGITATEVTNARLFFGDETMAIHNVQHVMPNEAGAWYTINGMKLSGQPTKTGLYIRNGRKVVVQ